MTLFSRNPALVVGLTTVVLTTSAFAVTKTWDNPGSGLFSDAVNWDLDIAPVAGDEDRIANGGTAIIDSTQNIQALFVILAAATGNTGTLQVTGGSLTTTSDIRIGNGGTSGGTGVIDQSGGAVVMQGGNLNVGFGDTAVGTYNFSGGTFDINGGSIIAVGNRGTGTMNQSGGSIYVRGPLTGTATQVGVGQINLGRNGAVAVPPAAVNPGTASGTYTLNGGDVTAALLRYGNSAAGALSGSMNVFNLQGGALTTGTISIINANASNSFNFTGGVLTATSIGMPLTNNGGTLSPASLFFGSTTVQPPLTAAGVRTSPIGTTTFTIDNSYVQTSSGVLSIEIVAPGSFDILDIGGTGTGTANLGGTIAVSLLSAFNPALGSTFDIVTADTITNTATISGQTPSGFSFSPSIVSGADARQVLRLTVIPEPAAGALLLAGSMLLTFRRRRDGRATQDR